MSARTRAHPHLEMEILKWMALLILAGAIALLLAGPLAGATPGDLTTKDAPAPELILPPAPALDASHETSEDHFATAALVWQAMQEQQAGNALQAVTLWRQVELPAATDMWRKSALAFAELQLGEVEQAARTLSEARREAPEHALVNYMLGVLRLTQSDRADEWYDASNFDATRLTAATGEDEAYTKSMHKLAAMMALERAVASASEVCGDEPLLPDEWTRTPDFEATMPLATPLVQDLLEALGLEAFAGRANLVLGDLHRERGSLAHAEGHLDRATEAGMATGASYRMLGKAYEDEGLSVEAARAYLKAMSHGREVAAPALKAMENLRDALLNPF